MAGVQGQGERTIYYKPRAGEGAYSGPKSKRASGNTRGVYSGPHTGGGGAIKTLGAGSTFVSPHGAKGIFLARVWEYMRMIVYSRRRPTRRQLHLR